MKNYIPYILEDNMVAGMVLESQTAIDVSVNNFANVYLFLTHYINENIDFFIQKDDLYESRRRIVDFVAEYISETVSDMSVVLSDYELNTDEKISLINEMCEIDMNNPSEKYTDISRIKEYPELEAVDLHYLDRAYHDEKVTQTHERYSETSVPKHREVEERLSHSENYYDTVVTRILSNVYDVTKTEKLKKICNVIHSEFKHISSASMREIGYFSKHFVEILDQFSESKQYIMSAIAYFTEIANTLKQDGSVPEINITVIKRLINDLDK